jgi:hypothetical protein
VGARSEIALDSLSADLEHPLRLRQQELLREWLGTIILLMNVAEQELLFELVKNPPVGSKIKAAKDFGVDLTLNLRSLGLSPAERVQEMENALSFAQQLREGMQRISE